MTDKIKDAEKVRLTGLLNGLTKYLDFISEYAKSSEYRGDMSSEINRVSEEVEKVKKELNNN